MPRKKRNNKAQRASKTKARSKNAKQGLLGDLIDMGADTIKGIGRGVLPGLFKTQMTTAPNQVGIVAPRAVFKTSSNPQKLADFDPERSIRLTGNGLFTDDVFWPPLDQTSTGCFLPVPDVNPYPAWRGISPLSIDPRAYQLVSCYQFYAFRMIRFTYIPETSTAGDKAEQSLVLAFSQDAQEYSDLPNPSPTQLMEQNVSILTPIWAPCTITYTHDGTRTWRVNPQAEGTLDDMVQCLLGGLVSTRNGTSGDPDDPPGNPGRTWTRVGRLYVEYVLDCYEPQPVESQGGYTVALPFNESPDGTVYGISFQGPGIFEYPDGYNQMIPFAANPFGPPVYPTTGDDLITFLRTLPSQKVVPKLGHRPKNAPSVHPKAMSLRLAKLEALFAQPPLTRELVVPGEEKDEEFVVQKTLSPNLT